ncbi:MAG: [protein-PII] uridylyltransferase [Deltaproteobacteria bacterium]|nr:[protein-PII] uridylyltransferase [Deltaproteobacteria bacterium]
MDAAVFSRSLLEETRNDFDLARGARAYLDKARALLLERHRAGAGGSEIVSAYTTIVDHLIQYLFQVSSQDYSRRFPSLSPRCTLVAQGGYGRGELNPYSDIDLLFLYAWKLTPYVESVAEKILYSLWDAGLQVGHAIRNISESMRLASRDMRVKTALLDARFICGDSLLYGDFGKAGEDYLIKRNADRFIHETLEERRRRHENYGASVYLLEPDVKEGEGGLRDIHAALWIAKVRHRARDLDDLVRLGIIQPKDLSELKNSQDFLWRVRNELHFYSAKHQDQLTFEAQERVSQALGFEGERTLKGVEVFMRNYYLQASNISRLTSLITHRITDCTRPSQNLHHVAGRKLRDGLEISRDHLYITDARTFASDPANLIRIFVDMQRERAEISHESRELLREQGALIDDTFRVSADANLAFVEILKWKDRIYETLVEMHRCGILGSFIPEFGRLLCMVLHDAYHTYTVDQHSLRLIHEVERLKAGEFKEAHPLLTQLAREIEKVAILYLALLFHDIGKGYGGGHSEIGAGMVKNIASRMQLNEDDTAQLEFLVRHHLLLAHTAFRRDLEDDKTIMDFARTMGSVENLKMLFLLTYADIRAVGPGIWNNWKANLLEELYLKALRILERFERGEYRRADQRAAARRIQARVRRRLAGRHPVEKVQRFLESMPDRYFLSTPEDQIPAHFTLKEEQFSGQTFVSRVRHFPERDHTEFVICTRDRPGLFASITGVLAALGLDIVNARITTSRDGFIVDVFRISHSGRPEVVMEPQKWNRVAATLEGVLTGSIDVARLVEESRRTTLLKRRAPNVPTSVQIDNEASDNFTVIEVYTQDRIGVLFRITYTLHRLGISIHLAKISTNVDQVADVFYVSDMEGMKIVDSGAVETIRQSLYESLVSEDAKFPGTRGAITADPPP